MLSLSSPPHLIRSLEWWYSLALGLIKGVGYNRSVTNVNLCMRLLLPCECVLHPVLVITVGEVLACVGTTGLLAVCGGLGGLHGASQKVTEFESLDKVAVPDHAAILGTDLVELLVDLVDPEMMLVL